MDDFDDIKVQKIGHIQVIELDRPPHNYFDNALIKAIADRCEAGDRDDTVRVNLLCANGKSFCAGADFTANQPTTAEGRRAQARDLYGHGLRIFRTRKPIVAAVQGHAIGGGLGVALTADFRIATPETSFAANFTRIGFHPGFALTATLPDLIGRNRALDMMVSGRRVRGPEALSWGLCNKLVPLDDLRQAAFDHAMALAEAAPLAVVMTRETVRAKLLERIAAHLDQELDAQSILRETEDFAEGVAATAARRQPAFKGR